MTLARHRPPLLLVSLLALAGCGRSTPPSPTAAQSAAPSSVASAPAPPPVAASASEAAPVLPSLPLVSAFEGATGVTLLHLERDGEALRGHVLSNAPELTSTALRGKMLDERRFALQAAGRSKARAFIVEGELEGERVTRLTARAGGAKPQTLRAVNVTPFGGLAPEQGLRGTVGDLRVRAQLSVSGTRVTGYYRYSRSRDDLKLDGSVDLATGRFALQETGPKGEIVGSMEGLVLSPNHVAGRWQSPDGARTLPLWLEAAGLLAKVIELPGGVKAVPREEHKTMGSPHCLYDGDYFELDGLADRKAQAALNRALRPEPGTPDPVGCGLATADGPYNATARSELSSTKRAGFLGVQTVALHVGPNAVIRSGRECKVIDLAKGKAFALGDLLAPGAGAALSKLVTAKWRAQGDRAEARVGDALTMCLYDDKVGLLVENNEKNAPAAERVTEVDLTFAELKPLMKKDPAAEALLR